MEDNDLENDLNVEELENLAADAHEKDVVKFGDVMVQSFSITLVIVFLLTTYYYATDDEIPVYACPNNRDMDAPVSMKRVTDFGDYQAENYIRGFVRQYIRAIYPKNSAEAKELYTFAGNHSKGSLRDMYLSYAKDHVGIGRELDAGKTTEFHPLYALADNQGFRISSRGSMEWVVEIDGFLNNRISAVEDDRGVVTLRLVIVKDKARLNGSHSGLYVDSLEVIHMANGMTDAKKKINP